MPAYNFKRAFADAVRAGVGQAFAARHPEVRPKRQTIRKRRKRRTRAGETLYLYVGQRTKRCEKLGEATCRAVVPIVIHEGGAVDLGGRWPATTASRPSMTSMLSLPITTVCPSRAWWCSGKRGVGYLDLVKFTR
jgi:hypothetical protein